MLLVPSLYCKKTSPKTLIKHIMKVLIYLFKISSHLKKREHATICHRPSKIFNYAVVVEVGVVGAVVGVSDKVQVNVELYDPPILPAGTFSEASPFAYVAV